MADNIDAWPIRRADPKARAQAVFQLAHNRPELAFWVSLGAGRTLKLNLGVSSARDLHAALGAALADADNHFATTRRGER